MTTKTIKVDYLARVEGEGSLYLKIRDGDVEEARLEIFEPPRFFEAFLRGRMFTEAPDITARICGICPVAYQMSAVHAMENAAGVKIEGPIRDLRRLIYCGEWIESHALHIYMLHAPDFLGYPDAIQMAKEHPEAVERGLQLKKAGNELLRFLGGREIHPVNVRVGGFYKVPTRKELQSLRDPLERARDLALETVQWAGGLPFPNFERDYEFVAMRHEQEYPFNEGRIVSSKGLDIAVEDFDAHFEETHEPHSTALYSRIKERGAYFVGPMARYNLNYDHLPESVRKAAAEAGLGHQCKNPFQSIVVRSIEVLFACEEALRLIEKYEMPDAPYEEVQPGEGATGFAASEAPRGILYHRYQLGEGGLIDDAQIVPPTSQNQKTIELDLRDLAKKFLDLPKDQLRKRCEQTIRNYDPCISCAAHFLKLEVDRG